MASLPGVPRGTRSRPRPTLLTLLSCAVLLPACAPLQQLGERVRGDGNAARQEAARPIDGELAAATFDTAWARVRNTYYDADMRGIDWDSVRAELRPAAAAARTYGELRRVLATMLAQLGESHFGVIPGALARTIEQVSGPAAGAGSAEPGITIRLAGGELLVFRVEPGSPAAEAGVQPGWVVETIAGHSVVPVLAAAARLPGAAERRDAELRLTMGFQALLRGDADEPVRVRLRDGADERVDMVLPRRPAPGTIARLGYLPPMPARLTHYVHETDGARIGVISFNVFMPVLAAEFDAAVDALRDAHGIVIDVRGNPGGVAPMVMGIAGHFIGTREVLGVMRRRDGELRFVVNPRRVDTQGRAVEPFAGPVAIVTDELSASTSEIFAAGMRALGRATIFGERTAGWALPAMVTRLPNDDALMHVVADLTAPDGSRLEVAGVVPDMLLPLRRDELLAGRDAALDAAVEWIADAVGPITQTHGAARVTPEPPPPAAALVARHLAAIGGADALGALAAVRSIGTFEIPGQGLSGELEILQSRSGRAVMRVSIPGFGDVAHGFDGSAGWSLSPTEGARLLTGSELAQTREELDLRALTRDTALVVAMESVGADVFAGERCHRVRIVWQSGRESHDCYSAATGLLVATVAMQPVADGAYVPVTTLIGEYRNFAGVLFPTLLRQQILDTEQILRIDLVEAAQLQAGEFEPPEPVRSLLRRQSRS